MSQFTLESWQEFIKELQESHDKHNCCTRDPIWMVQELQKTHGMSADYADKSEWLVDGETTYKTAQELFEDLDAQGRHEINSFVVEEKDVLFDDLDGDESTQDELLEEFASKFNYDWQQVYYVEDWVNIQVFATRHDADRFIERQRHNHKELRVYVESMWRSPQLNRLIQAVMNGELKLTKRVSA